MNRAACRSCTALKPTGTISMAATQEAQTSALVSWPGGKSAHTCSLSGRVADIAATGGEDLSLERDLLAQIDELRIDIGTEALQIFLPLDAAEQKLLVSIELAVNASARLFVLARGPARSLQLSMNAADRARADIYLLLDDAPAHFICEANVHAGTEVIFTGLTRTHGETVTGIEVNVRHRAGNSRTDQKFYSYARDTSQISFTGRITVDPGAGGTEAHQLHRGIALSAGARIDAQPFLNIMHDDVRCTHGSTVGFIDEGALAYLMARGIGRDPAEQILIRSSERQFFDRVPAGAARAFFAIQEEQL